MALSSISAASRVALPVNTFERLPPAGPQFGRQVSFITSLICSGLNPSGAQHFVRHGQRAEVSALAMILPRVVDGDAVRRQFDPRL